MIVNFMFARVNVQYIKKAISCRTVPNNCIERYVNSKYTLKNEDYGPTRQSIFKVALENKF